MKRRLRLFVYGTLQPDAATPMARWLAARTVNAEPASVHGRLLAMRAGKGWFPALVPAGSGARVKGTLCDLTLEWGDLAWLDRYEGREYLRLCRLVRTERTRRGRAQLYLWRVALPRVHAPIACGDFLRWLRQTRRRPYSDPRHGGALPFRRSRTKGAPFNRHG